MIKANKRLGMKSIRMSKKTVRMKKKRSSNEKSMRLRPVINVPQYPAPVAAVPPMDQSSVTPVPRPIINVPPGPAPVVNLSSAENGSIGALKTSLLPLLNNPGGIEVFTSAEQPVTSRSGILREIQPTGVIELEPSNAAPGERLYLSLYQIVGFRHPYYQNSGSVMGKEGAAS